MRISLCVVCCHYIATVLAYRMDELDDRMKTYDKRVRPYFEQGSVNVTMQLFVQTMGPVQENTFTYDLKFYLRQWWQDDRLALNRSTSRTITLSSPPEEILWTPDVVLVNAKRTEKLVTSVRTILSSNGTVYVSRGIQATLTCMMNLTDYPMDTQMCPLLFESYAYSSDEMHISWHESPLHWDKDRGLTLVGYDMISMHSVSTHVIQPVGNRSESYDNLLVYFKLKRTFLFYFYRAFAPTILLMVFNCGSFWIPQKSIAERMTLIVTTFLASAFILQSVTEQTVQVSYTTNMQLFLLVNICFNVGAVLEYLIILNFKSMGKKKVTKTIVDQVLIPCECERQSEILTKLRANATEQEDDEEQYHVLDRVCRYAYPLVYVVFCLAYFSYFMV